MIAETTGLHQQPHSASPPVGEKANKAVAALLADAQRYSGSLPRKVVDRTYEKRRLSIAECVEVERRVVLAGVAIVEEEDEEEPSETSGPGTTGPFSNASRKFLTEEDERSCGRAICLYQRALADGADRESPFVRRLESAAIAARERLVISNYRFVRQIAHQHRYTKHLSAEDLAQEGMVGLLRATELFDPDMGFRFKTYAHWWVRQSITRAMENQEREVRLPSHVVQRFRTIKRTERRLAFELGRPASIGEIATSLGMEAERLAQLRWSIEATESTEAERIVDGESHSLFDTLSDGAPDPEEVLASVQLSRIINEKITTLEPRDAKILRSRFGLDGTAPRTLEDIGREFGVTRERIRQIEEKMLDRLRRSEIARHLLPFLQS